MCREFSRCYDDVNICLWTNGTQLTQPEAQTACQQRNDSFLPRVPNDHVQYKLALFRSADNDTNNYLVTSGFWIDVKGTNDTSYQWVDGSPFAGLRSFICCSVVFLFVPIITIV